MFVISATVPPDRLLNIRAYRSVFETNSCEQHTARGNELNP